MDGKEINALDQRLSQPASSFFDNRRHARAAHLGFGANAPPARARHRTHASRGQLLDGLGNTLAIDGLWGLAVGNDGQAGSSQHLYLSGGPDGERHGVFGVLTAVPEPASALLLAGGLAVLGLTARRGQRVWLVPVQFVSTK